jgi:peptidoglycan/xylan/chitin deacetylase (PgdA/CDA1 family)
MNGTSPNGRLSTTPAQDATRLIALMYHEVTDDPSSTGFQRASALRYKHPVREFQTNLDQIARHVVRPERIDALGDGDRHLLLTFDDGGASASDAADILESRGWAGHFFIVTGLLDTPHFLSKQGVRDLHDRGHLIGSHSHTHPDVFKRLTSAQMYDEWRRSKAILEDITGAAIPAASIPGGQGDLATERAAAAAGYSFLFTSQPRLFLWRTDETLCIGRVCVKAGTAPQRVAALARGRGFARERFLWQTKSAVRSWFARPPMLANISFRVVTAGAVLAQSCWS